MMNMYQPGPVMALMNPGSYTAEINHYLRAERSLLRTKLRPFGTIIEAGCADGRYRSEVATAGKAYIGIDFVPVFIDSARLQHPGSRFICGDLQQVLPDVLRKSDGQFLVIFPFNVFGNLREPERIIELLAGYETPAILFGYDNSKAATEARAAYYKAAGCHDLTIAATDGGIRFTDHSSGLNTIAYSDAYLRELFQKYNRALKIVPFGRIGRAFTSL